MKRNDVCICISVLWVVLTVTPVFLDAGGSEGRAGDLADVIVRPVGRRSAYQVRQMFQTGCAGHR